MSLDLTDRAQNPRPGEELDLVSLEQYLGKHHPDLAGEIELQQFPSGYSNLTYLLKIGSLEVVLRRPPIGVKIKSAHNMEREHDLLRALRPEYPKVPAAILYCEDENVIGAPFFLMERISGLILRQELPKGLSPTKEEMSALSESFISTLHEIHSIDWQSTALASDANPDGYVARQIAGWSKRYMNAKTDEISEMDFLMLWLEENRSAESAHTLIHNDYKYDNLVLNPEQISEIRAVLDWEMATIGDPLMDLGSSLAYWIEADDPPEIQMLRFCVTHLPGNMTRTQLFERYLELSGLSTDMSVFYYAYGLFKLAVVVQQIYARYVSGKSKDPRFAHLNQGVEALALTAYRAIQRNSLS